MKKVNLLTVAIALVAVSVSFLAFKPSPAGAYEFKSFTVIESIIPNGIGRSRIINSLETRDYKQFTSVRSEEDNSRNKSKRDEIRVDNFEETKILNFYNVGGIRFQNIAANDAMIDNKVQTMMDQGWEIVSINSGVESEAGKDDGEGIYITRFYFKKAL